MKLFITAKPNSRKNDILFAENGEIKIKINAPSIDGKANESLIEFLSEVLHLPKTKIRILRGLTSRHKQIEIDQEEGMVMEKIRLMNYER